MSTKTQVELLIPQGMPEINYARYSKVLNFGISDRNIKPLLVLSKISEVAEVEGKWKVL